MTASQNHVSDFLEKLGNQPKDYDNDMMFATDGSKLEL